MSQDFYTEQEVSFHVEDKKQNDTDNEQYYETSDNTTSKHEQETGSFMTGKDTVETETPHPTTHDEESGSFIPNTEDNEEEEETETIVASVYLPTITVTDEDNTRRFSWTPYNSLKLNYETAGKYVVAGLSVCAAGYMLTRLLRR